MKIKLIDGTTYTVSRAEVTNGRLEIDFHGRLAEELQKIFSEQGNLTNIELLTDEGEKFGDVPGWTVYAGVMTLGDTGTVILTKSIDATDQRITAAESNALQAKAIAEDLRNNGVPVEQDAILNASVMVARVNAQELGDNDALKAKAIYNTWEELVTQGFTADKSGYKFTYGNELYKTVQGYQAFQAEWVPGEGTESIFTRIDEIHTGTKGDPIPAARNMEYIKGLYYLDSGELYLMNRAGMGEGEGVVLQFLPSELVGQYFEII